MGFYDKGHKEFHTLDMSEGWHTPAGYPAGIQQKIIAGDLDEKACHGNRTRFLRFAPGTYTTKPFVHEYWEEVFLVSGDLIVGNDEELFFVDGKPVVTHSPGKDTVSIIDIRDHAKSRIVATLPLENPSSVRRAKPDRVLGTRKTGRAFRATEQSILGTSASRMLMPISR